MKRPVNAPNGVVRGSRDNVRVSVLETRDAASVARESAHELARTGRPDFDGAVAARRDDVAAVEVHHVDGSSVAHQCATQIHLVRACHLPHGDRLVLHREM